MGNCTSRDNVKDIRDSFDGVYGDCLESIGSQLCSVIFTHDQLKVKQLLLEGADPLFRCVDRCSGEKISPIFVAAKIGSYEILELLLDYVVKKKKKLLDSRDGAGDTLFHIVVRRKDLDILKLLIEKEKSQDNKCFAGRKMLCNNVQEDVFDISVKENWVDGVRTLLSEKIKIEYENNMRRAGVISEITYLMFNYINHSPYAI